MKLATHIDSVFLMTSTDEIEELPWSLERMFSVLSLSDDVAQKAAMVWAFLYDTIRIRPVFPRPLPWETHYQLVYKKYVTRAEKKLYVVRCGKEEYSFQVPDEMLHDMKKFCEEMMRVRTYRVLDAAPQSEILSAVEAVEEEDQESVPQLHSDTERGSASQKYQKTCTPSDNEPTPSEMILFGKRQEEND